MRHILRCSVCEKFTMKELCCESKTRSTQPPKYSPEDKYASYRREAKHDEREHANLV